MSLIRLLILTVFFFGVASSCKKKENQYFPSTSFEQYIYLNNPSSYALGTPGGYIYAEGGYKGLIIYRRTLNGGSDDFGVYDRGCPEHYAESCGQLEASEDGLFAECSCKKDEYLLIDGSPGENASLPLYPYRVVRNGDVLYISN